MATTKASISPRTSLTTSDIPLRSPLPRISTATTPGSQRASRMVTLVLPTSLPVSAVIVTAHTAVSQSYMGPSLSRLNCLLRTASVFDSQALSGQSIQLVLLMSSREFPSQLHSKFLRMSTRIPPSRCPSQFLRIAPSITPSMSTSMSTSGFTNLFRSKPRSMDRSKSANKLHSRFLSRLHIKLIRKMASASPSASPDKLRRSPAPAPPVPNPSPTSSTVSVPAPPPVFSLPSPSREPLTATCTPSRQWPRWKIGSMPTAPA